MPYIGAQPYPACCIAYETAVVTLEKSSRLSR
jgi:hypothetical protein